ncbi:hypothetical protein Acr_00g0085980 [Actinidia rufa]|uniref:Uncharacterized protein n=1 Tax=Actinidia rufa TaxID=165716 RepID=A0A7J0DVL9_9ERIC|nr:hypothetical protein Acr_00g0085980 [Actinidia rufa]
MEAFEEYDQAKSYAIQSIRYLKKDKEVIVVDEETDRDGELDGKIVERDLQPSSSSVVFNSMNGNLEVGNTLETISLERKLELLGLPLHKKLFETAERQNPKLSRLRFEIELMRSAANTSITALVQETGGREEISLQLLFWKLFETAERRNPKLRSLRFEIELMRSAAKHFNYCARPRDRRRRRKALVTHENFNIEFAGEFLQCLRPGKWLNDEVVGFHCSPYCTTILASSPQQEKLTAQADLTFEEFSKLLPS